MTARANQRLLLIIDVDTLELRLARGGDPATRLRQLRQSTQRPTLHVLASLDRGMAFMPLVRAKLAHFTGLSRGWYQRAAFDYLSTQFDIKILEHEDLPTHVVAHGFPGWIARLRTEERETKAIAPAKRVFRSEESPMSSGEITEPPPTPPKLPSWMRALARTKL